MNQNGWSYSTHSLVVSFMQILPPASAAGPALTHKCKYQSPGLTFLLLHADRSACYANHIVILFVVSPKIKKYLDVSKKSSSLILALPATQTENGGSLLMKKHASPTITTLPRAQQNGSHQRMLLWCLFMPCFPHQLASGYH